MSISIYDLFDKYKDIELTLICLTDFNIKYDPYYYKAVFEYTNYKGIKKYPVAEIPPELFHKKYKIGAKFLNGVQIGYSEDINIFSFEIDNTVSLKKYKIRDIIKEKDTQLIDNMVVKEYLLNQNCFYIEYKDYNLIIPHYTIANHFHFKSASLRNAILTDTFEYLYYKNTFRRDIKNPNTVYLKIKNMANQSDLTTICSFLDDVIIFDSFKKYLHQKAKCKSKLDLCQIEAIFPYRTKFNIKTMCKRINTSDKPKIIVLGIYQDDYIYNFDEINYQIDKSNNLYTKTSGLPKFIKYEPKIYKGRINNKKPSSKFILNNQVFYEEDFGDINDIRLNPIYLGITSNNPLIINKIEKSVEGSYEQASSTGDTDLQQIVSSSTVSKDEKYKEIFPIEKFSTLFEELSIQEGVSDYEISNLTALVPRKNKLEKIPSKYFILDNIVRCYIYGSFKFNNRIISFIEIEANKSWHKISTWFFILNNSEQKFTINTVNDIVFKYINKDNTLEEITESLNDDNIIFIRKHHPTVPITNENKKEWAKSVLKYISSHI